VARSTQPVNAAKLKPNPFSEKPFMHFKSISANVVSRVLNAVTAAARASALLQAALLKLPIGCLASR